ncbi:hypothetical protein B0I37DRAFT_61271 [Chaetomium sp. MPI-CAGE-AT-0009]|nr:hypothetical protein B0I37DRAFT_61271 [Chaetomium sp. MPI-CAGE-AT-0009]
MPANSPSQRLEDANPHATGTRPARRPLHLVHARGRFSLQPFRLSGFAEHYLRFPVLHTHFGLTTKQNRLSRVHTEYEVLNGCLAEAAVELGIPCLTVYMRAPRKPLLTQYPPVRCGRVDGTLRLPVGWLASTAIETCRTRVPQLARFPRDLIIHSRSRFPTMAAAATPAVPLGSVSGKNSSAPSPGPPSDLNLLCQFPNKRIRVIETWPISTATRPPFADVCGNAVVTVAAVQEKSET